MDYKLIRESALILFFFIFLLSAAGNEAEQSNMEVGENKMSAFETVRSMFSLPSVSTSSYWMKVKTKMNQAQTYFFPPNLDFRSSDEAEAIERGGGGGGGGGAGEKVKEAAVKTWGESKSTVEDSAKLAGETLQKTAHKVKDSLSSDGGGGGAGEKVKEAAVKTWGKSKSTVEDSAKLAGETLQKTAHKAKDSLSSDGGGEEAADPRTEL